MYTGLKGGDCLMDGGFILGKKTGTKLEAFYGFRLIPKMKDCDFKVFACKKKEATIRNLKDCIDK